MAQQLYALSQKDWAGETFGQREAALFDLCLKMGQWAMATSLEGHPLCDPKREHRCPRCGGFFRVLRPASPRDVQGRLGRYSFCRPYGTCDRCRRAGHGVSGAPMDWALGLGKEDVSIGLMERVNHASMVGRSFSDASKIAQVHDMVDISAGRIRELAEGEGRRLVQARGHDARAYEEHRLDISTDMSPELLVICADGGRVQTRTAFAGRGEKQNTKMTVIAGGKGTEQGESSTERWKESKIGVVYDATARPQQAATYGAYRGAKAKIKTHVATLQPWETFGRFLGVEAQKRGYAKAKEKIFLADGAATIRELQSHPFQDATFILDWPHAAEHLFACATAAFGEGTRQAVAWHVEHRQMLWDGKVDALIRELEKLSRRAGAPREEDLGTSPRKVLHRNATSYFPNNRKAMAYPDFRMKGWPLGSGVVEAAVKQFGIRMKNSEMFWNIGWTKTEEGDPEFDPDQTGAEDMLALRALYLSEDGRWEKHWKERDRSVQWN